MKKTMNNNSIVFRVAETTIATVAKRVVGGSSFWSKSDIKGRIAR
jgi:hypothetical protein